MTSERDREEEAISYRSFNSKKKEGREIGVRIIVSTIFCRPKADRRKEEGGGGGGRNNQEEGE